MQLVGVFLRSVLVILPKNFVFSQFLIVSSVKIGWISGQDLQGGMAKNPLTVLLTWENSAKLARKGFEENRTAQQIISELSQLYLDLYRIYYYYYWKGWV